MFGQPEKGNSEIIRLSLVPGKLELKKDVRSDFIWGRLDFEGGDESQMKRKRKERTLARFARAGRRI